LLRGCQAHFTASPLINIIFVMQFKIFAKLPSSTLLLASCSTVVRQISVGVVVEETRHGSM
jgi:hypothetical protein